MTDLHDATAERIVVGCLLDHVPDEAAGNAYPGPNWLRVMQEVADTRIGANDFWLPRIRNTFAAILSLRARDIPVTEQNVHRLSRARGFPDGVIPVDWLFGLMDDVTTTVGVGWWCQQVIDLAQQRRLVAAGVQGVSSAPEPKQTEPRWRR